MAAAKATSIETRFGQHSVNLFTILSVSVLRAKAVVTLDWFRISHAGKNGNNNRDSVRYIKLEFAIGRLICNGYSMSSSLDSLLCAINQFHNSLTI